MAEIYWLENHLYSYRFVIIKKIFGYNGLLVIVATVEAMVTSYKFEFM